MTDTDERSKYQSVEEKVVSVEFHKPQTLSYFSFTEFLEKWAFLIPFLLLPIILYLNIRLNGKFYSDYNDSYHFYMGAKYIFQQPNCIYGGGVGCAGGEQFDYWYLPLFAILLSPFGFLSFNQFKIFFLILSCIAYLVAIYSWERLLKNWKIIWYLRTIALCIAFSGKYFLFNFYFQQSRNITLALIGLILLGIQKDWKHIIILILFTLLCTMFVLFYLIFGVYILFTYQQITKTRRKERRIFLFKVILMQLLCNIHFIIFPNLIGDYIRLLGYINQNLSSPYFGLLRALLNVFGLTIPSWYRNVGPIIYLIFFSVSIIGKITKIEYYFLGFGILYFIFSPLVEPYHYLFIFPLITLIPIQILQKIIIPVEKPVPKIKIAFIVLHLLISFTNVVIFDLNYRIVNIVYDLRWLYFAIGYACYTIIYLFTVFIKEIHPKTKNVRIKDKSTQNTKSIGPNNEIREISDKK